MSLFTKLANAIFSPVDAAGHQRSVLNGDAQVWGTEVERILAVYQAGGGIVFPDLDTANASLAYNQNQMAWVMGDPTPANNGVYRKIGASGTGSWARMGDLPYSMIRLDNAGAGTADAIVATSALPLPVAPGAALMTVNILAANTGNVTLNGKPLRTNSGNEISAGGLTAGSIHAFLDLGDHFRLLSDQASAAIVSAAEAAQLAAEDAAERAESAASGVEYPVSYAPQTLTPEQQTQARENIGISATSQETFLMLQSHFMATNLEMAEMAPGPLLVGMEAGNGVFDGFNDLVYVDTSGATNLDTGDAGVLKPTITSGSDSSSPPTETTSDLGSLTIWDRGWSLVNGETVDKIGLFSADAFEVTFVIVQRNSATSYTAVFTESFAHPGGGWADLLLASPYTVPSSGTFHVGVYTVSPNRYPVNLGGARGFNAAGVLSGTDTSCTENTGNTPALRAYYASVIDDMEVTSVDINLPSSPDWARITAIVDLAGGTLNADLAFSISRDGDDFKSAIMGDQHARTDGTIYIDSGLVDLTDLDPGTKGRWKIETANGCPAEIHAVATVFGDAD